MFFQHKHIQYKISKDFTKSQIIHSEQAINSSTKFLEALYKFNLVSFIAFSIISVKVKPWKRTLRAKQKHKAMHKVVPI